MFKLIKEYNELLDMWYNYRKLCKRLSRIRYYRRYGKFKPERVSIFKIYKNAFKKWLELFNRTFFVKEEVEVKNIDLYRRYKEKQESKKLVAKTEYNWYITAMKNCVTPLKKHNQYEYPVGKTITHVRWIEFSIDTYFTKNKIYKVNKIHESSAGFLGIYFETDKDDKNDHCRVVFENYERKYDYQIELIYDNNI